MAQQKSKHVQDRTVIMIWNDTTKVYEAWDGEISTTTTVTVDPISPNSVLVDEASSTITYVGEAIPGTATSATTWQVKRINSAVLLAEILYADGDNNFDNRWDDRAALSYS
jgi:hypothetical protein